MRVLRDIRRWGTLLALAACMIRTCIPVGLMPDAAAARDGIFQLVICYSAANPAPINADAPSAPQEKPQNGDNGLSCPFAGHGRGDAMLPDAALAAPAVAPASTQAAFLPQLTLACATICGPPLPARGPPIFL